MVRHLKHKIVDKFNNIVHHSYSKQKAEKWIKDFGKVNDIYHIKKLSKIEMKELE